ncbi:LOW QUALITY PROTEIN: hypothetical protein Cgig2_021718 [Carnegiea gigantea]|uniref:Uncharacterized protein n=1 Tax=Carnegiea gigantea TaxID=171969 RepID=A0A9Q1GWX3_9CARY|nr:LOW QUALITY PROTEIN: hypothetical protein Cgig2_021718 [Carnegiea gigantea]
MFLEGAVCSWGTRVRSPADWLLECRGVDCAAPASPAWGGADTAVSSGWPSVRWCLRTSKLIAGFFLCGTGGGACGQNNLLVYSKLEVTMKGGKQGSKVYFLSLLGTASPLPDGTRHRLPLAQEWHPWSQRPSTSPSLALHKTKGKSGQNQTERLTNIRTTNTLRKILKDQKAHLGKEEVVSEKFQLGEPIQRFPVTRLAPPPLRALHRFYCMSHKLGDEPRLIVMLYVELEAIFLFSAMGPPKGVLTGLLSFQSRTFSQPDSRWTKRKSYFQYFTFNFFLMVVMNPGLHNLCGRQFVLIQNLFNHRVKRKSETIVESRAINCYTFGGRLVHDSIRLGNTKVYPAGRRYCFSRVVLFNGRESDCPDHPAGPSGLGSPGTLVPPPQSQELYQLTRSIRPFMGRGARRCPLQGRMSRRPIRRGGGGPPEVELVLVEATSAPDFDEVGVEQGLPCVPSANNSSGDLMQGVDLVFAILHT